MNSVKNKPQTKSLECEMFLIGSKEVAGKRGGEVAEKKIKSAGNCKEFVVLDVYQNFYNDQRYIFIPYANRVLANHGKYILGAKEKYFLNKILPSKSEHTKIWSTLSSCRSTKSPIGNKPSADPSRQIHRHLSNNNLSFLSTLILTCVNWCQC